MMIKAVHLLWIIPAAVLFGIFIAAVMHVAHDEDEHTEIRPFEIDPTHPWPTAALGFDLDHLLMVAQILQSNMITPSELKTFCDNLAFAFDVVRADMEKQISAAVRKVTESMTTGD